MRGVDEIRKMTDDQILDAIEDGKVALYNLRFQVALGQQEDTNAVSRTRREIARLKTILRERQLAAQSIQKGGK